MMMGMAGGVFGQAPLRLVVETLDWRRAMLVAAAGGLLIAIAAWATVRDRRRGIGRVGQVFAGLGRVAQPADMAHCHCRTRHNGTAAGLRRSVGRSLSHRDGACRSGHGRKHHLRLCS